MRGNEPSVLGPAEVRKASRSWCGEGSHLALTFGRRWYKTGGGKFADKERWNHTGEGLHGHAKATTNVCELCGAWRGAFGLEPTIEAYVEHSVQILREIRRVLRPDGVCFWNIGDSYASGGRTEYDPDPKLPQRGGSQRNRSTLTNGLKAKDLCLIPARVAIAAQQPYYSGRIKRVEDRVWLAAMIDAEGCMFIHKRKAGQNNGQGYFRQNDTYGPGLEVTNTSERIVQRCMEIVGAGSICSQGPEENPKRKQRIYRWNLRLIECRDIIREVYPYLVGKKQQARILCGCPSSGEKAEAAHAALIGLHNGVETDIDFHDPESMYEPGWYVRSDVIWNKLNPMPESVRDRPTDAYEHILMLTKSAHYYWNEEAVKEPCAGLTEHNVTGPGYSPPGQTPSNGNRAKMTAHARRKDGKRDGTGTKVDSAVRGTHAGWEDTYQPQTRNLRNVWTFATAPYKGAHFATFPPELARRCILAGSRPGDFVMDPFGGSGTVARVALELRRKALSFDLAYHELAKERTATLQPILVEQYA